MYCVVVFIGLRRYVKAEYIRSLESVVFFLVVCRVSVLLVSVFKEEKHFWSAWHLIRIGLQLFWL